MHKQPLPGKYGLSAQKIIRASAANVWKVLADFSTVDTWAPQVTRSYSLSQNDRGLGAQRHCDIKGFGSIEETVTDWVDGQSLTYDVTPLGPLATSWSRWTVRSIDEATSQMIIEFSYDTRFGFLGILMNALMMRRKLALSLPQTLEALKQRVETGKLVRPRRSQPNEPHLAQSLS